MWRGWFSGLAVGAVVLVSWMGCAREAPAPANRPAAAVNAAEAPPQPLAPPLDVEPEDPPAVGGGGGLEADASPLGLLGPVFPGLGGSTHSARCDPFEDSSEVCL